MEIFTGILAAALWIAAGGIILYAAADAVVFIPAVHFGVIWRFGGQTKGTRKEGLNFKIPFVDQVRKAELELKTDPMTVIFTTKDRLRLTIPGSLQFRADRKVEDKEGRNVFVRISEKAIVTGIEKDIQAKLGGMGGKCNAEEFIYNRQALADIINSILRLDTPLHLDHIPNDPEKCGKTDCTRHDGKINAENLIKFYNDHWQRVKAILDDEKNHEERRAEVEKRYGIDISTYSLSQVDFTEETEAAQEEERQAGYRVQAARKTLALAIRTKRNLRDVAEQQALNWADATLNPGTPRQMISIEGDLGAIGGLLGFLSKKEKGGKK